MCKYTQHPLMYNNRAGQLFSLCTLFQHKTYSDQCQIYAKQISLN